MTPDSYYERIDDHRYKPTIHVGGAWSTDEQHFSPLGGLVAHAIDRHRAIRPHDGLVLSRISYDILGRLALDECEIEVETVRPGRTIELLEAVVRIADRPVVRARAWLLSGHDTAAVAGGSDEPPSAWIFPNVDLTVHLQRRPRGAWTGLDTTVTFGPSGQGLTGTVLHDVDGPVGHAQQILTVRPVSGA